jgi:predicted secreted Zn-dependent protease
MNKRILALLISTAIVTSATAYYDQYGTWHSGTIEETTTNVLDAVTGGRYSDTPEDRKARVEAERKLKDKQISSRRKYQDTKEKIQRKKEDRRNRRIQ